MQGTRWIVALGVIAAAWLAAILVAAGWTGADQATQRDPAMPWLEAGTVEEIRSSGVVYVREGNAFVVAHGDTFVGLSDVAQHIPRERVLYCPTSGWFVGLHGEMFDRLGNYALGPASSGLMRLEVRVVDDRVEVNPERALGAPERGSVEPERRSGPFCGADGEPLEETQPGLAAP